MFSYGSESTKGNAQNPVNYDKVIETRKLFSLLGSIWKHLEAFGSIWKHVEAFGSIWKHLEAFGSSLFSLFYTVLTLTRQHSEKQRASRFFQNSGQTGSCFQITLPDFLVLA
jgi:hypothetical protein